MADNHHLSFIDQELQTRKDHHQLRTIKNMEPLDGPWVRLNNRRMLNFSSNDYLGLARHPLLRERAIEWMERLGAGATASRLVCGSHGDLAGLEEKIASLKSSEAALVFNSGFQANVSYLPALTDRHSLIVADRLSHNSLIQGSLLSRCKFLRFRHNDLVHLDKILKQSQVENYSRIIIVTESVFSMDGDRADIAGIKRLADKYGCLLVVDEAHATGVFGKKGMGLCNGSQADLILGTFGKGCGAFGAYIACSEKMRQYLINCCTGLIYSTGLPPQVLGAIDGALELLPAMLKERERLQEMSISFRDKVHDLGFDTGCSDSQIIPLIVGPEEEALALSKWFDDHDIYAMAIRPPTVEKGRARIRLALSVLHSQEEINRLLDVLGQWQQRHE